MSRTSTTIFGENPGPHLRAASLPRRSARPTRARARGLARRLNAPAPARLTPATSHQNRVGRRTKSRAQKRTGKRPSTRNSDCPHSGCRAHQLELAESAAPARRSRSGFRAVPGARPSRSGCRRRTPGATSCRARCRSDRGLGRPRGRGARTRCTAAARCPLGSRKPPISASSCKTRRVAGIGPSKRRHSSTAGTISFGSCCSARSSCGMQAAAGARRCRSSRSWSRSRRPSRPTDCVITSSCVSLSPSCFGADRARSACRRRAACGAARSASVMYCESPIAASPAQLTHRVAHDLRAEQVRDVRVQSVNFGRSSSGTPSISQMIVDGSGRARSAITSISPRCCDRVEHRVDQLVARAGAGARSRAA